MTPDSRVQAQDIPGHLLGALGIPVGAERIAFCTGRCANGCCWTGMQFWVPINLAEARKYMPENDRMRGEAGLQPRRP